MDRMGLTAEQRTYAWMGLFAGIVVLVVWLMYTPDTNRYGSSSNADQHDRTRTTSNSR